MFTFASSGVLHNREKKRRTELDADNEGKSFCWFDACAQGTELNENKKKTKRKREANNKSITGSVSVRDKMISL